VPTIIVIGPGGVPQEVDSNEEVRIHAVDQNGDYVGLTQPADGLIAASAAPPNGRRTRWDGSRWILSPTLAEAKLVRWDVIKQQRQLIEEGGFVWDGSTFDSDARAQSRITTFSLMADLSVRRSQAFSATWVLADNTARVLSANQMLQVLQAMYQHISDTFDTARALRQQILAATTIQQVEAVTWP
jgi:hypothetical protein